MRHVYPGLHPGLVCGAPLGRWLQSRLFATLRICPHPHSPRSSITCQAPQGCTSCFSLLHAVLIRTLLFLHISDCAQSCYLLNSSLFRNTDEKCGLTSEGKKSLPRREITEKKIGSLGVDRCREYLPFRSAGGPPVVDRSQFPAGWRSSSSRAFIAWARAGCSAKRFRAWPGSVRRL